MLKKLQKGLIRLEIRRACALLIIETDCRIVNTPLIPTISPNTSNQNFEIAILFDVVKKSGNYVLRMTLPHSPQGKGCKL
jgi:hypothetical protein